MIYYQQIIKSIANQHFMVRTFLLIILSSIYLNSFAGWEIITKYYSSSNNQNDRSDYVYISAGYMKIVSGDITTVFNLQKQEIIYINKVSKRFWQGNTIKFNEDIRADLRRKIDEVLKKGDKSQRENQKRMYEEMLRNTFTDDASLNTPPKNYSVKKLSVDQTVAGYKTYGYQVYEDVMPLETIWVAPSLKLANDFDFRSFSNLLQGLVKGSYGSSFENNEQYFKLLQEGYPLKVEMHLGDGQNSVSEVVKVTNLNLDKTDFSVPIGYTAGTLTDVGVWDAFK
jgi:hypothetical protein